MELTRDGTIVIVSKEKAQVGSFRGQGSSADAEFSQGDRGDGGQPRKPGKVWKLLRKGEKVATVAPDKTTTEYSPVNAKLELKDSPILGRWSWVRKGSTKESSLVFTPWGTFVGVRWVRKKADTKGSSGLEELREAGVFSLKGNEIHVETYRRKVRQRVMKYQILQEVDGEKLKVEWEHNGKVVKAEYTKNP